MMTSLSSKEAGHYVLRTPLSSAANEGDISQAALSSTRLFILIGWLSHREFICVTAGISRYFLAEAEELCECKHAATMMPQKARPRVEKRRPTNWTCSWSG
eukprot:scaffold28127_cov139-Skeletonema_dohrnii-CCMP3373.AAC.4